MNKVTLVLGDWSGDGHKETDYVHVSCNLAKEELEKAYTKGCKKVGKGFSMEDDVASDYEDSTINKKHLDRLRKLGFKDEIEVEAFDSDDPNSISIYVNDYVAMWMFIASLGSKEPLFWSEIEDGATINIGGYGLFD